MKISPQLPRIHSNTTNSMPYCYWVSTLEQRGKQNTLLLWRCPWSTSPPWESNITRAQYLILKWYHNTAWSNMKHLLRYWGLHMNFSSASKARYNISSSIHERIAYFVYGMPSIIWILKAHTVKPTQSTAPSEVFPPMKLKKNLVPKFSHMINTYVTHFIWSSLKRVFRLWRMESSQHNKFLPPLICFHIKLLNDFPHIQFVSNIEWQHYVLSS